MMVLALSAFALVEGLSTTKDCCQTTVTANEISKQVGLNMNIVKTSTKPVSMYINLPFFEQLCCYVTSGDFASRMDNINLVSISLQNFPYRIHFLTNLAYKLQILLILQNCCGDDKHKLELCKKKKTPTSI